MEDFNSPTRQKHIEETGTLRSSGDKIRCRLLPPPVDETILTDRFLSYRKRKIIRWGDNSKKFLVKCQ